MCDVKEAVVEIGGELEIPTSQEVKKWSKHDDMLSKIENTEASKGL